MKLPPLQRAAQGRILFGVCAGVARGFGVDVVLVRLVFAALVVLGGGIGVIAYGALVLLLPREPGPVTPWPDRSRTALGLLILLVCAIVGLAVNSLTIPLRILIPAALLAGGVALVWRQVVAGRAQGERPALGELARVLIGIALLAGGAVVFLLDSGNLAELSSALVAAAVVATGLGLLLGPRLVRARAEAEAERRERIRTEERAHVAARLHDSVLQTLALIQRVDDPRRAQSLARRQERELRGWLYGGEGADGTDSETLANALRAAADEVEEHYGVAVDLVQPSDGPLDEDLAVLAAAAREAMTNAGRHAGVGEISVLARVGDDEASVFVRDRGAGFDLDAVAEDRRGVRESIVGRMARAGGRANVVSAPGEGTEVELVLPRQVPGTIHGTSRGSR